MQSSWPQVLVLPDGRRLGWREYGDPTGAPCVYVPGTPASSLVGALFDESARRAGVRWIAVDKPGYGLSDPQAGRRVVDTAADLTALVEHLALPGFVVAGESGGGPYALALAHALPERVRTVMLLASLGPVDQPGTRVGMKRYNRALLVLGQRVPAVLVPSMALQHWLLATDRRADWLVRRATAHTGNDTPEDERALLTDPATRATMIAAHRDAFRSGPQGPARELGLLAQPWGFDPAKLTTPVVLWHGTADGNVPISHARRMAARLPHVTSRFLPGAGHAVALQHRDDVLRDVVDASANTGTRSAPED